MGGLRIRRELIEPAHGGPARLLVPHLYFWKSAKWVRGYSSPPTTSPASGVLGLPQLRRPLARAALLGRLEGVGDPYQGQAHRRRIAWRLGEVIEIIPETPRTKSPILGRAALDFLCGPTPLVERRWQLLWSTWDMTLRA